MYKLLGLEQGKQNLCPFPHKKQKDGKMYMEKTESCGISNKGEFNCFVCGRGYTDENWFTSAYLNCTLNQAKKFNEMLEKTRLFIPQKSKWKRHQDNLKKELEDLESPIYKYLVELELLDIIDTARLGLYQNHLTLPTFYKGQIINICQFCPGEVPKYRNSKTAISGVVTATKSFTKSADYIMICAGEKDMLQATKHGFNAISIMGGEKAKPTYYKNLFKEKKVYIAYDNDIAGVEGALSLAKWLYNYTTKIKVLNSANVYNEEEGDLTAVAKENKEDISDFFLKYKQNDIDLNNVIDNTKWYQPPALEHESIYELVNQTNKLLTEIRKKLENINGKR